MGSHLKIGFFQDGQVRRDHMISVVPSQRRKFRSKGRRAQKEGGIKTHGASYLPIKEHLGQREKRPGTDSLSQLPEGAPRMLDLGL